MTDFSGKMVRKFSVVHKIKRIIGLTVLVMSSTILLFGQKTFENRQFGFSMEAPKGWVRMSNKAMLENQRERDRSEEELAKILENEKSGIFLAAFYKYDPKTRAGLIPVIQIYAKAYTPSGFKQFKSDVTESSKGLKTFYTDFEYLTEPTETEVSGIQSMYFIGKFTMKGEIAGDLKVRTRSYFIPYKNYFFQLGFNDGQTEEDNAKLFDKLVKTIKIGNL